MQQQHVLSIEVFAPHARIYEEGWQSWSPSSDRITDLDEWGLDRTRTLLGSVPPATPMVAAS